MFEGRYIFQGPSFFLVSMLDYVDFGGVQLLVSQWSCQLLFILPSPRNQGLRPYIFGKDGAPQAIWEVGASHLGVP